MWYTFKVMYMYKSFIKRILDVVFSLVLIILLLPLFLIISLFIKLEDGGHVFFKQLPQLINILRGEMSFIGPRPWITDYAKYFTSNQMRRLEVLPGITGLAQSSGRNDISIIEKIKLDVEYVDNVSLLMDIKIIFKTISSVFSKKGNNSDKFAIQNELDVLKNQWKNPQHENDKKEETSYKEEVIYN